MKEPCVANETKQYGTIKLDYNAYLCNMKYCKSIQDFIVEYACADTTRLRLKNIEADFDVSWAILQIEARKKLQNKLPSWLSHLDVVFPSILSAEQCSSELTAQYKQRLAQPGSLLDLTGGLGVDSFYFAQKSHKSFMWSGSMNIAAPPRSISKR